MNKIQIFSNVKCFLDSNQIVWLDAEDVAKGFGFTEMKNGIEYIRWRTINRYLKEFGFSPRVAKDEFSQPVAKDKISPLVGKGDFLPENMVYRLGFKANNEVAVKFQTILADDVLPSIRKHGAYATPTTIDQMINNPEFGIRLLSQLQEERKAKELAQKEVKEKTLLLENANETITRQAPKVDYYDNVLMSADTMTTTQVAKSIGRSCRWLNTKLKECGLIYYQSGQWMLKSPYDSWNLHKVRTATFTRTDGSTATKSSTVWNERGRRFIVALSQCDFKIKSAVAIVKGELKRFPAA